MSESEETDISGNNKTTSGLVQAVLMVRIPLTLSPLHKSTSTGNMKLRKSERHDTTGGTKGRKENMNVTERPQVLAHLENLHVVLPRVHEYNSKAVQPRVQDLCEQRG